MCVSRNAKMRSETSDPRCMDAAPEPLDRAGIFLAPVGARTRESQAHARQAPGIAQGEINNLEDRESMNLPFLVLFLPSRYREHHHPPLCSRARLRSIYILSHKALKFSYCLLVLRQPREV